MSRIVQTPLATPIQGRADWRKYKAFQLENGVTCLVINDKESKTVAMSCVVEVGASSDPRELSGLAHFCEHMCFLGSEKYPGENEYKKYLASYGGRSNASTSMHLTNYKFEILADHAEKAVDIFSNFFVAPLFTSSGTAREVQAVNSENSKNLTADGRRRLQILKDIADPLHYFSKFSTGNSETLPTDNPEQLKRIREALLAFHRYHYRPEKMTVVIAGPQSIETLEQWIGERYSRISSSSRSSDSHSEDGATATMRSRMENLVETAAKDAPPYAFNEPAPPYNPAFKPSLLQIKESHHGDDANNSPWPILLATKPLRSMRKINMMFPIPSDRKRPDQSASSMLSHLLGHEGSGSAFAILQNSGLISSLSAGARIKSPDFTLFQIEMGLTEKGELHWEEAVSTIFAYCRLLQKEATSESDGNDRASAQSRLKRIWKELCDLNRILFHETSPGGVYGYVPAICGSIVSYGTQACISAGSMLNENEETFPITDFIKFANLLIPENCIIERCSEKAFEESKQIKEGELFTKSFGLKKESWYGVEYFLLPIPKMTVSTWHGVAAVPDFKNLNNNSIMQELSLPLPNRYIPRTLELCPELPVDARNGPRIKKPIDPPKLLVDEENWKLFHRLDDRYSLPKSSLHLLIRNMSLQNVKNDRNKWVYDSRLSLLSSLLAGAFNEAMAQKTYDASLAGLHWSLSIGSSGIKLRCFGFSDRLPDLALKVLDEFLSGEFLSDEKFFVSTKDRAVRSLRTYFESRRADSQTLYYRNALLNSEDRGINDTLQIAIESTFEDIIIHHRTILAEQEMSVQCLFSGNVSSTEAKQFFSSAKSKMMSAFNMKAFASSNQESETLMKYGLIERQLKPGEDIELHFSSQNAEDENGAVLCTYQSSIPSYKGQQLSDSLALHSTSAIRLLCHIMREPLFNSLRTKQQLGYIVNSRYEIGISSQSNENGQVPLVIPVDFISINVLSQKMSPSDIIDRIDDFMETFRKSLEGMPESKIRDYANSLATKLLKPVQKLEAEASMQYLKIARYGPEVFHRSNHRSDGIGKCIKANDYSDAYPIPWNTTEVLATSICSMSREDLLKTFDRMTHPSSRSRVVSCVYGRKFPLKKKTGMEKNSLQVGKSILTLPKPSASNYASSFITNPFIWIKSKTYAFKKNKTTRIVDSFSDIVKHRAILSNFNLTENIQNTNANIGTLSRFKIRHNGGLMIGVGLFGMAILGTTILNRYSGDKISTRSRHKLTETSSRI